MNKPPRPKRILCAACATLIGIAITGCGYPRISGKAFELAKTLDNVCNLRDETQLAGAQELVDSAHEEGKISDRERQILIGILAEARGGDWKQASREARELLTAQTSRS